MAAAIFQHVTGGLEDLGLSYEVSSPGVAHFLLVDQNSELKHMDVSIANLSESKTLSICATAPFVVKEDVRLKMAQLIARTNSAIRCARFDMNWDIGTVSLTNSVVYGEATDIKEVFKGMMKRSVHIFTKHIESFYYVTLGADPAEALTQAQRENPYSPGAQRLPQNRDVGDDIDNMGYEELSLLCEMLGDVKSKGMTAGEAELLKAETYKKDVRRRLRKQRSMRAQHGSLHTPTPKSRSHSTSPVNRIVSSSPVSREDEAKSGGSSPLRECLVASGTSLTALSPVATDGEDEDDTCCICMEALEEGESIKTLPCLHTFHADELDQWLQTKRSCPICNTQVHLRCE